MSCARFRLSATILIFAWMLVAHSGAASARWPGFRGLNGSGIANSDKPPIEFSLTTNFLWKTSIPAGHSSPCIWDEHIFLTCADNGQLETLCIRRSDGRILWRKQAPAEEIEKVHEFSSPAAATVASDGDRVYVCFGSYGLLAYDMEGDEVWKLPLQKPANNFGTASSPILSAELVIMLCDSNDGSSRLLAVNRGKGTVTWTKERPLFSANWSTPIVWRQKGVDEIIVAGSGRLVAYGANDGAERWWVGGFPRVAICAPVIGDNLLFAVVAGQGGGAEDRFDLPDWPTVIAKYDQNKDAKLSPGELPAEFALHFRVEVSKETPGNYFPMSTVIKWFDADKDGLCNEPEWRAALAFVTENKTTLIAIRPGASGDATATHVVWKTQRGLPEIPSPIFYQGRLFTVRDGGLVSCFEPKDGRIFYQERLGTLGQYSASLVAANGHLYAASVSGTVTVFKAGDALEVRARNQLNERIVATPAIADDKLYIRTAKHLYAFGK